MITGGTAPYTVNVFVANAVTLSNYMLVNTIITSGTTWSNTITTNSLFTSNSPLVANVVLTDSHPTTVTSAYTTNFIVNPALGIPTLSASNTPTVDTGQYELFSSSWSGGTTPYTANYQVFNTITGTVLANAIYTGITGTSNTFSWVIPAADAGNTISANVFITDSAATPVTVNSVDIATITISAPITTTTSTTTTTVATTTAGGGGNSGGIILNTIIPSSTTTATSTSSSTSTSSTSSTSSTTTSTSITTTTTGTTSTSTSSTTTIKPVIIVEKVNVSEGNITKVNFTRYNITVALNTSSKTQQHTTISFYSPTTANVTLDNYTNVFSFYLNDSSSAVSMNVTLVYNCTYGTNIAPFVLENSTWNQIYTAIILQNPCRITFPAPNRHLIGLFKYLPVQTTLSTTAASTATTTVIEKQAAMPYDYYYAAAVLIIAIAVYFIWRAARRS